MAVECPHCGEEYEYGELHLCRGDDSDPFPECDDEDELDPDWGGSWGDQL